LPEIVVEVDPFLLNAGIDQQMNKAIEILGGTESGLGAAAGSIGEHHQEA
jgi:hypothetical protein